MNISRLGASALLVASVLAAPAMAAPAVGAAPAQPAAAAAPANAPGVAYTKQVGDWTIQCTAAASPNPCEMTQGVAEKNTGQRLLTISFFYIPARDQNFVVMQVPLGVSISNGLILKTDTFTSPKLPYHQCDRNGCYAELPIDKNTLQNLGTTGKALVQISDASRNYDLGLSLKGFADANNALVELSKQRAKNPPPAPAGDSGAAPSVIK
jgi:invasion protein IalB